MTDARDNDPSGGDELVWRYGDLEIRYASNLDGGGTELAASFVRFLRERYSGRIFRRAYEWCSGPGFIGLSLLQEGICESLCLADVNPEAVDGVRETLARNRLEDRVSCYLSDGWEAIPDSEVFDLVVSNPPNFCGFNPDHPRFAEHEGDLRPHDPDWRIHEAFYRGLRPHLSEDAVVCISEVEPFETHLVAEDLPERIARLATGGEPIPFEIRPRPPIEDFRRMIGEGGLTFEEAVHFATVPGDLELWMVISRPADHHPIEGMLSRG